VNSRNPWNRESGASLVAIMMSLALFGIVAVMASEGFRNINVSGRRVEAAMSARDIENVIMQAMVQRFKTYIANGCTQQPNNFFNGFTIGNLATVSHKNVRFYNETHSQTVLPPAAAKEDLARCNGTLFSTVAPASSHTFYGCFDLKTLDLPRGKASQDAFASNRGAFIEMYVKLKNFKTDAEARCNEMIADRGFGLEVYHAMHWTTPAGNTVMYDNKLGTLNAAY